MTEACLLSFEIPSTMLIKLASPFESVLRGGEGVPEVETVRLCLLGVEGVPLTVEEETFRDAVRFRDVEP